jgi:serine/threonine protein kinase
MQERANETMTAERWAQVKTILAQALERGTPEDRTAFLEESCEGDTALLHEIEALLARTTGPWEQCAENAPTFVSRENLPEMVGRRIGAYEIVREIGRGGMGAVYLARRADGEFEKEVAVKLLKRGTDTDEVLRRFRAERQILARLDHPNIARLLDAGTTNEGLPYFVMEHVVGTSITRFVREQEVPISGRLQLFVKICSAVQFAHQNLVVHRDLKPGNILIGANGEPKLLDFGIAKLLASGDDAIELTLTAERRFTPVCASPEQARGEPVTTASDVYALGALLYELLTEQPPHRFSTPCPSVEELVRVIGQQEAFRPSLTTNDNETRRRLRGDLDRIVLMALRKEPEWRYASVNALVDDIQSHLSGRPIAARKRTTAYVAIRFLRRQEKRIGAAAALAAAGIALGFLLFHSSSRRELSIPPSQPLAKADIPEQATQDHEAYDLFLRARGLAYEFGTDSPYQVSLTNGIHLLEEATARDPTFALAYSLLAESHLYLYRAFEHTDAHLAAAKQAADAAQRLAPESGAAHFAQAVYFYEGVHDLHRAETEITAALRAVPTRADAYEVAEKIERRLGRWKDAIEHGEKAIALDPRDPALIPALAEIYIALRRFADVARITDRALATLPPQFSAPLWRYKATAALGQGDTKAARVALQASPAGMKLNDYIRFRVAVLERNFEEAERIADSIKAEAIQPWLNYQRGLMARVAGNNAGAKRAFEAARDAINKELAEKANDPKLLGYLALVEAGLGKNEQAVTQAQRAVDLAPISEDASNGAKVAVIQAEVYAWVGQPHTALEKLATLVIIPDGPNYGDLLLDPVWDPLRAEPAFAQLLEEAQRSIDPIPNIENASTTQAQTIPDKSIAVLPFSRVNSTLKK